MIHFQDSRTQVEIAGRVISIVPRPGNDQTRAAELHALFPLEEGWRHFPFGVHQTSECESGRHILARMAETRIRDGRPA